MNNSTPLLFDRVAVEAPEYLYQALGDLVAPEHLTQAMIMVVAVATVAVGVSLAVAKPKRAAMPDPTLPLYHPSDNDNCKYIITTRAEADLGDITMKGYQVALVPVSAAATLAGLYWLMKQTPEALNWYLNWMFCVCLPVCSYDAIKLALTMMDRQRWVRFQRYAIMVLKDDTLPQGPMDGDLDPVEVHKTYPNYVKVWPAPQMVDISSRVAHYVTDGKGLVATPITAAFTYLFYAKNPVLNPGLASNWLLTNAALFAYTVTGIGSLQLARFSHACLLLLGLFVYDIYFVFGTPMMETVALGLDVPIKFVVPREGGKFMKQMFLLIGTGDLVVPGVFILFLLRFDYHQYYSQRPGTPFHHARAIPRPYYIWGMVWYTLGLALTMVAMHTSQRGQPALLYIVPCVILGTLAVAKVRGEVGDLFRFDDEIEMLPSIHQESQPPAEPMVANDDDDSDANFELDDLYDEWMERVEQKRDELIEDTDDDDPVVYQFLLDNSDDDDTFVIDSGDGGDSDGGDSDDSAAELAEEIIAIRQELSRPPQEWYSDED